MATDHSSNEFYRASWLVYINGLEIPVASANVSFGVWSAPALSLDLLPHYLIRRLGAEDRIQVVGFYLDYHWDPDNPTFRLLDEFEVVGISYRNTPVGRYIQLNCLGHLTFFKQLNFFYISSVDDIAQALSKTNQTDTSTINQTKVLYPFSLFYEGLLTMTADKQHGTPIKRPVEFVMNVFKALLAAVEGSENIPDGATVVPASATSVPGKNFFARWLQMTQFYKRWMGFPGTDDLTDGEGVFPLIKATIGTQILESLNNRVGSGVGRSGTAWDLLQYVLGYMYMEIMAVPAPPAFEADSTYMATGLTNDKPTTASRIAANYVKPSLFFALPPTCNVFFPSQISSLDYSEQYREEPTRLYLNETFISRLLTSNDATEASTAQMVSNLMVTGYPEPVRKRMKDVLSATAASSKNMLLFPEEFFMGPIAAQASAPEWLFMLAQDIQAATGSTATEDTTDAFNDIFDAYARYEYYRRRYAARSGTVQMAWNPYVIPGLPGAVFDKGGSGLDIFMYITNVSHSMNASGALNTSVSFSFVRTMEEFAGVQGGTTLQIMADNAAGRGTSTTYRTFTPGSVAQNPVADRPTNPQMPRISGNGISFRIPSANPSDWTQEEYAKFNQLCADKEKDRKGQTRNMDPNLIPALVHIGKSFPGKEIQIHSAFRQRTNPDGTPVASQHWHGTAIDFSVSGVSAETLWVFAVDSFPKGYGIGYYPNAGRAIHLDTRYLAGTAPKGNGNKNTNTTLWVHRDGPGEKADPVPQAEIPSWLERARAVAEPVAAVAIDTKKSFVATEESLESSDENLSASNAPTDGSTEGLEYTILTPEIVYDMYPAEPISELAQVYQKIENAQLAYARLLYGSESATKPAVFDWKSLMRGEDANGQTFDLRTEADRLTRDCNITPSAEVKQYFDSYDLAMRYAARPACSLQEYIRLWHGPSSDLAQVQGDNRQYYSPVADGGKKGAIYPTRIYKLRQGPGPDPGATVTNVGPAPDYAPVDTFKFAAEDMAQTRQNWDERLEQYRKILISAEGYKHPQG